MKVEYINPFIEGVNELFLTMLGCEALRGKVGVAKAKSDPRDVTALIGLSGPARGIVALTFPIPTALAMVSKLLGTPTRVVDATVSDAVAEMVNIVAGRAKSKFQTLSGDPINLSLPTVVRGNSYKVDYPSKSVWLDVPFESELGSFSLRVTFDDISKLK
ncbi:chemotaxis protein CheX [bacterium]|nr:chemotaxis protein CheX [bacterium]